MRHAYLVTAAASLLFPGCAHEPPMKWHRVDGRSILSDPALHQRAELDHAACQGERAKAIASGSALHSRGRQEAGHMVLVGCMADRGYVLR